MHWRTAILTASDRGARGDREDTSAKVIQELIEEKMNGKVIDYRIVPDEMDAITSALIEIVDEIRADLIITCGGTGLAPRDVTPEATQLVIDRLVPGLAEAMRAMTITKTRRAMLSRGICGIRGSTLIINLPGSPKAVSENLNAIIDMLPHALGILTGIEGEHKG